MPVKQVAVAVVINFRFPLNQNEKRLKSTIDHLNKELADVKNQSQQLNQDQENLLILLEEMEKKKKIYKQL